MPDAVFSGLTTRHHLPVAGQHIYLCIGHRFGIIQRGNPNQEVIFALFNVYPQVSEQYSGSHIHGVTVFQQGLSQMGGLDFKHMKAGLLQRQADYLKITLVIATRSRQIDFRDIFMIGKNGNRTGIHLCFGIFPVPVNSLVIHDGPDIGRTVTNVVQTAHAMKPVKHILVGLRYKITDLSRRNEVIIRLQMAFHIAHRQGDQGGLLF